MESSLFVTSLEKKDESVFEEQLVNGIEYRDTHLKNLKKDKKEKKVHIWHFVKSKKNQELWKKIKVNDWCLFGLDGKYIIAGKFLNKIDDSNFAKFNFPKSITSQSKLYAVFEPVIPINLNFLKTNREFGITTNLSQMHKITFLKINDEVIKKIRKKFGTIESFLRIDLKQENLKVSKFPVDAEEPPKHIQYTNTRIIRDTIKSEKLKKLYDHKCQICNFEIEILQNKKYAEVHHVWPLGEGGMDNINNMIVLCPNHHTQFDYAIIGFDKYDSEQIVNKHGVIIGKITFKKNHILKQGNIKHHMEKMEKYDT